jgi:AhpD family alkylhydroperoxidase
MSRCFPAYDLNTAPVAARPLLEENLKKFGLIPSPLARYAESPAVLQAAIAGLTAFEHTSLEPIEREVLAMVMGRKNGCDYCINLHRKLLRMHNAPAALGDALEHGGPLESPKLEALRSFVLSLVERTGDVSPEAWRAFLDSGFNHAAALEVVMGVAVYTLTTFANRLTEAPLD